ncbi:hypothetical protein GZH49_25040 [Nocardia terpenica]|uniref:hypothetical protein n=1 Tax=Nocardia terpenica TaxID=455432 RepID=UPI002FE407EA
MTGDHKREDGPDTGELARIIVGLRHDGRGYRDIADTLGVTARQVETVLGEARQLHAAGLTVRDIGQRIGLPRSSVQRLVTHTGRRRPPTSSARTTLAMTLLADSYGLQLDLLAMFLTIDNKRVYPLVHSLRRDHLVLPLIRVQPGDKWVVPTGEAAASYLGWRPYTVWRPREKDANHYRAVAQARLMLVGTDLEAWVSERRLRHDAAAHARHNRTHHRRGGDPLGGAHIHDGRFQGVVNGTYGWWALEVELTAKSSKNMDIALQGAIRAARYAQPEPMTGLLYLCRGTDTDHAVHAAYERLPIEFERLDLLLVVRDFDLDWTRFLDRYRALRAAAKAERLRNNPIRHQHPTQTGPATDGRTAGGRAR